MFYLLSGSCEEGGGISLLGNEDQPIFRGYKVLPDQPEFLDIFLQAISVKTNS